MAMMVSEEVGLKRTGEPVNVANDPRAKLMYYLQCVSTVMEFDDARLRSLIATGQHNTLTDAEETALLYLAALLGPKELVNKVFFESEQLCGDSNNQFYELSRAKRLLAVTDNVLVAGRQTRVTEIMTFKKQWMVINYYQPLVELNERRKAREAAQAAQASCTCAIL